MYTHNMCKYIKHKAIIKTNIRIHITHTHMHGHTDTHFYMKSTTASICGTFSYASDSSLGLLCTYIYLSSSELQAGDIAHLVECSSSVHTALRPIPNSRHCT